jgi:hypothetical protein
MREAFAVVVFAVVALGVLGAVASLLWGRGRYDEIGAGGLAALPPAEATAAPGEREAEIAQMRAARDALRALRGSHLRSPSPGTLRPMAALRRFELDELVTRPGTYFNPQTEVILVVDDNASVDLELLEDADDEGGDWILVGDEPAVDEHRRDELVEAFETRQARSSVREDPDEDVPDDEEPLEPDPDEGY